MVHPVRIGVVGAGSIANSVHFPSLREIEGIELSAVCDLRVERAGAAAEKYGFQRSYDNSFKLFEQEKLDGVFLLVQPDQAFRLGVEALRHGINVFMEKPAGLTLFQTESLAALAGETGRILQVGMNRRYIPLIREVLAKMRAATEITQIEGCFVKHGDASFFDGCGSAYTCDTIHSIDLMRYIAGCDAERAATVVSQKNSRVSTAWNSVIRFQNGMTGLLKANYQTGGRVHSFELHGPDASAYIDIGFGGESCKAKILYREGTGSFSLSSAGSGGFSVEELDGIKIAQSSRYYRYYGYYHEDKAFLESIQTGQKPLSDITDSVDTMRLAEFLLKNEL